MLRLYGTRTSPYVRRVRIVADEVGMDHELLDTATPEGQDALRARSPIWKVPAAELDGEFVLDSHVITELMLRRHGNGKLAPFAIDDVDAHNVMNVIDGALDALINVFYLAKDGVDPGQVPYLAKQRDRVTSAMTWLEQRLESGPLTSLTPHPTADGILDLPGIALGTSLAWMVFRDAYPVSRHPRLQAFLDAIDARPSFVATRPPT